MDARQVAYVVAREFLGNKQKHYLVRIIVENPRIWRQLSVSHLANNLNAPPNRINSDRTQDLDEK